MVVILSVGSGKSVYVDDNEGSWTREKAFTLQKVSFTFSFCSQDGLQKT